ncbi:GNAT family N-acetyltransferase [Tsuneonella sp. HG222]
MIVRVESPGDAAAIHAVHTAAFADHRHSEGAEPDIVDALRAAGDLSLSLVAEIDGAMAGHAAWSEAVLATGEPGWFALGPIGVVPRLQRCGIGKALIAAGDAILRERGAKGVVLVGDPAYYGRLGFRQDTALFVDGPLADYFQVMPFVDDVPAASVGFAPAFGQVRLRDTDA